MQDHDPHAVNKPKKPWVKVLFAMSLALNFAFIGLIAGAFLRNESGFDRSGRGPGVGAFGAPYMLALPREERRAVVQMVRSSSRETIPDRRARREMFQDVVKSLRATPFDVEQLRQVVVRQADVSVLVQERAQQAWLDVVAAMSDEERADYASKVQDVLKRGSKRR